MEYNIRTASKRTRINMRIRVILHGRQVITELGHWPSDGTNQLAFVLNASGDILVVSHFTSTTMVTNILIYIKKDKEQGVPRGSRTSEQQAKY